MWVNISPCVWMWEPPTGLQVDKFSSDLFLRLFLLTGATFLDHDVVLIDTIIAILPVHQQSNIYIYMYIGADSWVKPALVVKAVKFSPPHG